MNKFINNQDDLTVSIMNRVRQFGFTFQAVVAGDDNPTAYVYTIGASEMGNNYPELIMSGNNLEATQMQDIMYSLVMLWRHQGYVDTGLIAPLKGDRGTYSGLKLVDADQLTIKDTHTCQVYLINPDETYNVVQVMFPDRNGKYPDENGYDQESYPQEDLTA